MPQPESQNRPVNRILGSKPNLGPLPGDQLGPWALILFFGVILKWFIGFGLLPLALYTVWGVATYWLLTADYSWRFKGKFVPTPRWTRGMVRAKSLFEEKDGSRRTA